MVKAFSTPSSEVFGSVIAAIGVYMIHYQFLRIVLAVGNRRHNDMHTRRADRRIPRLFVLLTEIPDIIQLSRTALIFAHPLLHLTLERCSESPHTAKTPDFTGFSRTPTPENKKREAALLLFDFEFWWGLRDSNPRPAACKAAALTN